LQHFPPHSCLLQQHNTPVMVTQASCVLLEFPFT
jgi:hypothetical protein